MPRRGGADWSEEELVLALHTYQSNLDQDLVATHPSIVKLSEDLRQAPLNLDWERDASYRPPDGVRSRVGNFRRIANNQLDNVPKSAIAVWDKFGSNSLKLKKRCDQIRTSWQSKKALVPSGVLPFIKGRLYKRSHLHDLWGGSRQSGIAPSAKQKVVFIFTGESGEQHGYEDRWVDGVFRYAGEGQRGDMALNSNNMSIIGHVAAGKDLLLFKQADKRSYVTFEGQMIYTGHDTTRGVDTDGNERELIIFDLVPIEEMASTSNSELENEVDEIDDLGRLRELAMEAATWSGKSKDVQKQYYRRSFAVKNYALRRAAGSCESCKLPAPFETTQNAPYLEVHHVNKLSDGGPDHPDFVIALCPNCHRKAHYSKFAAEYNLELKAKLATLSVT
ncbi:HNH endonuclease [Aliamphritea hakodatensis]|uniref:HNH endonuclease n=1 Tax=Aliamphritea hakodatensis TaxID=2895352 RepID=UPI0022FD66CF|nr:HNH endonuclease [Aliamphritea hakodatensis]